MSAKPERPLAAIAEAGGYVRQTPFDALAYRRAYQNEWLKRKRAKLRAMRLEAMDLPKCAVCGARHRLSDPHQFASQSPADPRIAELMAKANARSSASAHAPLRQPDEAFDASALVAKAESRANVNRSPAQSPTTTPSASDISELVAKAAARKQAARPTTISITANAAPTPQSSPSPANTPKPIEPSHKAANKPDIHHAQAAKAVNMRLTPREQRFPPIGNVVEAVRHSSDQSNTQSNNEAVLDSALDSALDKAKAFDKRAYQRAYMAKRRAEKNNQKP